MILLAHMLFGAAVASKFHNPYLAIFFAFLSHYFLDFIPHEEYNIFNIKAKNWSRSFPDFTKVSIDFLIGAMLVLLFSKNSNIFFGGFISVLPDVFAGLNGFLKTPVLNAHDFFHHKLIHYFKRKKISMSWRILSQIIVVIAALIILTK